MGRVDAAGVALLRELLAPTGWVERSRDFARALRRSRADRTPGGLLLVGTEQEEPWHLAAHLDDEARFAGIPELAPTLVRWAPPAGAPAHLAIGLERLEAARRGETVFVVAPQLATAPLLERVDDARRIGATVLALDSGDAELQALAHETLTVPGAPPMRRRASGLHVPSRLADEDSQATADDARRTAEDVEGDVGSSPDAGDRDTLVSMEVVQHLVSSSAVESGAATSRRTGWRDRLGRFLDVVSGPAPGRG